MKIKSISLGDLKIKFALFFFLNSLSIFCLSSAANTNTSTVQTVSEVCTIEVRPKTIKFSNCAGISQKEIPTAIFKIQFLEAFRWPLVTEAIIKRSPKYYKLSHGNYRRKILDERIEKNRKLQQNMISFVSSSGFDLQLQNELLAEIENWTAKNQDNLPPPKKISPVGLLNLLLKKSKHTIPKPELEKNPILIALLSTRIFRDHLSKIEYLKIPEGIAQIGSQSTDRSRFRDEDPMSLRIKRPFFLQKTTWTQSEWFNIMGSNPSRFQDKSYCPADHLMIANAELCPQLPVENVSAETVNEFIKVLTFLEPKHKYRLPTDLEWEFAARGGKNSIFWFGDDLAKANEFCFTQDISKDQTSPVATKSLNPFGLADTCGNAWQLTKNKSTYYLKGGSWTGGPRIVRPATKLEVGADEQFSNMSFRLIRE